jgi:hypothetical protein
MARRPHRAKGKIAPDHTPRVRSNILRSDRYEFVAVPSGKRGEVKKGEGWGDVIDPGELAVFGNPG